MSIVTVDLMVSLDGCMAGPDEERLHAWIAGLASWRARQGLEGGVEDADSRRVGAWFDRTGAVVMGRTMFDGGVGFWAGEPPFRVPVFVVTHRPAPAVRLANGTRYTFVTDGLAAALDRAREAAGDRDVDLGGGASVVQQGLRAGLVDELTLHVLPFTMGEGLRWWDGVGPLDLERVEATAGEGADHLRYRVLRG
ncbi:MAG TPA: dihydrofolate reductase family protein [Iamia sp.]|nr:dihydrofolate reductase family protein [Iamia sp.]